MIFETIVTTVNARGQTHIAPMGIRHAAGHTVIAPFRPSTTLENVQQSGHAVINFTDDVRIFAGCLCGRRDWPTIPTTQIPGRRLTAALSHQEVTVSHCDENDIRPQFYCETVHCESHAPFAGFNRAQAAVIEGAVLASRLDRLPREKVEAEFSYLQIAIDKTAGEREREAWSWLRDKVRAYHENADNKS